MLLGGEQEELDAKRYLEEVMGIVEDEEDEGKTLRKRKKKSRTNRMETPKKSGRSRCIKLVFFLVLPFFLLTSFLVITDYPHGRLARSAHKFITGPPGQLPDFRALASEVSTAAVNLGTDLWEQGSHWAGQAQAAYKTGSASDAAKKASQLYASAVDKLKPALKRAEEWMVKGWYAGGLVFEKAMAKVQQVFPFLEPMQTGTKPSSSETKGKKGRKPTVKVPEFVGADKDAKASGKPAKGHEQSASGVGASASGSDQSAKDSGRSAARQEGKQDKPETSDMVKTGNSAVDKDKAAKEIGTKKGNSDTISNEDLNVDKKGKSTESKVDSINEEKRTRQK